MKPVHGEPTPADEGADELLEASAWFKGKTD
jgi:hypothetical protein